MTLTPFILFVMGDDSLQQKVFIDVTFSHDTNSPPPPHYEQTEPWFQEENTRIFQK